MKNPTTTLAQALAQARHSLQAEAPPADGAARLHAALAAAGAPPRPAAPKGRWRGWALAGTGTATLLLVGSLAALLLAPPPGLADDEAALAGFMPLVPAEDWPAGDAPAWVVKTEMPRERLVLLGLPFDPSRAGDSVHAELLVRPSGQVLAVRFLQ